MDAADAVRASYESPPAYTEAAPGVPEGYGDIRTLGDLLEINYKVVGVREQLRRNLEARMSSGEERYPGIIGYDGDVAPALDRAILAGHDMLLVGQMGQAKTRIAETVAGNLLSPMPVVRGSPTNDTPMDLPAENLAALLDGERYAGGTPAFHVSPETEEAIKNNGLDTPVRWVDGLSRSRFVVGTPDITTRDLVGYVDAVKMTKKGVEMYSVESYTAGHLMQAKHGVFCIDELPVLDPRKQVALLSVLQEGRFTAGAYPVTFRPKCLLVATANPVDYTHSGRIIEPLYDRLRSHVRTRHPAALRDEMAIMMQEADLLPCCITLPVLAMLARTVRTIRKSPLINRDKGVSVRMGIHGLELLVAEARRVRPGETPCPRPSDFGCLIQVARFELSEVENTARNRDGALREAAEGAARETGTDVGQDEADAIKSEFTGKSFTVSQGLGWRGGPDSYGAQLGAFPRLAKLVDGEAGRLAGQHDEVVRMAKRGAAQKFSRDGAAAVATETVLERLRWSSPKVLERRDSGYAAA